MSSLPKSAASKKKPAGNIVNDTITVPTAGGVPVFCAHTHIVPIEELVALKNPRNPNKHPPKQLALLGKILRKGWRYSVVVSLRSGLVVKGHGRIDAAALAKLTHAPVDYQQYATEADELADMLADNAIAELSERDMVSVTAILSELDTGEIDLDLTGYDEKMIAKLMEAAPPETPKVVPPMFAIADIVESAAGYFRAAGFPYRKLPLHVCMQHMNKLAATGEDAQLNSIAGYHVADTYHPHRFHGHAEGKKSPFVAFADDKLLRRALSLSLENGASVGTDFFGELSIVSGTQACYNFRPAFAMKLYREFTKKGATVLDTSTGYGGRLVGFMASGIAGKYIGVDPSTKTHEGNLRMASDLGFGKCVELVNLPAEDVPINAFKGKCDFAFTSPPYFCKEHYSEEPTQSWKRYGSIDQWLNGFLAKMLALQFASLKKGATNIVNIADVKIGKTTHPLVDKTIELGEAAGFAFIEQRDFDLPESMGANIENEATTEPVLIFRK